MVMKAVNKVRGIADILDDYRLVVGLLTLAAILTKDEKDLKHAISTAENKIKHNGQKAEGLSIICRFLAIAHMFEPARKIARRIGDFSRFWEGEAWVHIYSHSAETSDRDRAQRAATLVNRSSRRDDIIDDLERAEAKIKERKSLPFQINVDELNQVLAEIEPPRAKAGHEDGLNELARKVLAIIPKH